MRALHLLLCCVFLCVSLVCLRVAAAVPWPNEPCQCSCGPSTDALVWQGGLATSHQQTTCTLTQCSIQYEAACTHAKSVCVEWSGSTPPTVQCGEGLARHTAAEKARVGIIIGCTIAGLLLLAGVGTLIFVRRKSPATWERIQTAVCCRTAAQADAGYQMTPYSQQA